MQKEPSNTIHPYFFFGALVEKEKRKKLVEAVISEGVELKTWSTVNVQEPYRDDVNVSLDVSMDIADRVILLPIHNNLSIEEAEKVSKVILDNL